MAHINPNSRRQQIFKLPKGASLIWQGPITKTQREAWVYALRAGFKIKTTGYFGINPATMEACSFVKIEHKQSSKKISKRISKAESTSKAKK